jgi:DNA-binding CsgD family transcriptional regulator
VSELVDRDAWLRSEVLNEFYIPHKLEHHLTARLSATGYGHPGCTAVVLSAPKPFDVRDLRLVHRLLPALEGAVRRSGMTRDRDALATMLERDGAGHLLFNLDGRLRWRSMRAGALLGGSIPDAIVDAVRRVAALAAAAEPLADPPPFELVADGPVPLRVETYLAAGAVAVRVTEANPNGAALASLALAFRLTRSETVVLARMASGARNREIAGALQVSPETVRTHVHRILRKLGVRSRTEAVIRLREHS